MNRARQWGPWVLLVLVAAVGLAIGFSHPSHPSLDDRVTHIANEVRCPVCNGETVAQSGAAVSLDIKSQIRQQLLAGRSDKQILAGIVAAYGSGYLEKPQTSGIGLLVWVLPVAVVAGMVAALILAFRRWRPQPTATPTGVVTVPAVSGAPGESAPKNHPGSAEPTPGRGSSAVARRRWLLLGLGVALIGGGSAWAVSASSSPRAPGQAVSGQALAPEVETADIQAAQSDVSKDNVVGAIKEYQKVLDADPTQPQALTGEGWLLAETQQPNLLAEGIQMLTEAEAAAPSYVPAHLYRGLALFSEGNYKAAIPELRWYLDNGPDPSLAPKVKAAVAQAQAAIEKAAASTTSTP